MHVVLGSQLVNTLLSPPTLLFNDVFAYSSRLSKVGEHLSGYAVSQEDVLSILFQMDAHEALTRNSLFRRCFDTSCSLSAFILAFGDSANLFKTKSCGVTPATIFIAIQHQN